MVLGEISKDYADMIFDENGAVGKTLPLKREVARVVGRLLYVDSPKEIRNDERGFTTLTRFVPPKKTVVFSVYGSKLASGNVDIHVGGTYIGTTSGESPAAAISSEDEKRIGDGVFQLLTEYIKLMIKKEQLVVSDNLKDAKPPLPDDLIRSVAQLACGDIGAVPNITRKYDAGKRKTRKGKKKSRKLRKLRKTRGRK